MSPKIIAIVAYILIIIGIIGVAWGLQPTEGDVTASLPSGAGYYSYIKISMWLNGHVSGSYEVTSDGTVRLLVLDSEQFDEYSVSGYVSNPLDSSTSTAGSFSADLPTTGAYYIVVEHASTTDPQEIDISYKVTGIDLTYLIAGAVLLAIGAVLAVVSMRMKAKAKAVAPPAPVQPTSEVVMFDKKK